MLRTLCFFALLLAFGCAQAFRKSPNSTYDPSGRVFSEKKVCYRHLGCFSNASPWFSVVRPLPLPMDPSEIDTTFFLHKRNYNEKKIDTEPIVQLVNVDFNINKETVIIVHGFASDSRADWMQNMAEAILKRRAKANVILTDWAGGARMLNYLQAASNTRVVGAELARLVRALVNRKRVTPDKIHCIGHSLGAHICGYMGKRMIKHGMKIDWITALDPAGAGFELAASKTRLTADDAVFVEAVHTDAKPLIPTLGFGMMAATGTVDLYMNGGALQPGCSIPSLPVITNITDLAHYSVEKIIEWIKCPHKRAAEYYISSLLICRSKIIGPICRTCPFTPIGPRPISECDELDDSCQVLGLESRDHVGTGSFYLRTTSTEPFCEPDEETDEDYDGFRR